MIGSDPLIKKRVTYLSNIEGKGRGVVETFTVVHKYRAICWSIIKYLFNKQYSAVVELIFVSHLHMKKWDAYFGLITIFSYFDVVVKNLFKIFSKSLLINIIYYKSKDKKLSIRT